MPPRVASDARLVSQLRDLEQNDIPVAIGADFMHLLHVARFFTLEPELAALAAEIHGAAQFGGLLQRFAVHPRQHQHITRGRLLRNGRRQSLGIPGNFIKPISHAGDYERPPPNRFSACPAPSFRPPHPPKIMTFFATVLVATKPVKPCDRGVFERTGGCENRWAAGCKTGFRPGQGGQSASRLMNPFFA